MSLFNMTRATFVEPIHDDDFRSYFATRQAPDYRFARPQMSRIAAWIQTATQHVHRFATLMLDAIATAHARRVGRVLSMHGLDRDHDRS